MLIGASARVASVLYPLGHVRVSGELWQSITPDVCPGVEPARAALRTGGRVTRFRLADRRKEPDVAGKKRPKSLAQTEKKAPAKPKRPKKTSRGK